MSNRKGFFNLLTLGWLRGRKKSVVVYTEEEIDEVLFEEDINEAEEPCKVLDVYVDIQKEIMLHYKHCAVHGYTIPVDMKTVLYKSNIFFHPNVSADNAPACILHNAEVPGSERNRFDNGRNIAGRPSIEEIPAVAIHKFKLAEETRADGANEIVHNSATSSNDNSYSERLRQNRAACLSWRHSEHDRPTNLELTTNQPRQKKLTSKSVVFITPDEENSK